MVSVAEVLYYAMPVVVLVGILVSMLAKIFKVHAASDLLLKALKNKDLKACEEVLDQATRGVALDGRDANGLNPLHLMVQLEGSEKVIEKLLVRGNMDVQQRSQTGWSALHYACESNNASAAQALIDHSADVNALSEDGWTPLHVTCMKRSTACMQVLLKAGADESIKTSMGRTAFEMQLEARGAFMQQMQVDAASEARKRASAAGVKKQKDSTPEEGHQGREVACS